MPPSIGRSHRDQLIDVLTAERNPSARRLACCVRVSSSCAQRAHDAPLAVMNRHASHSMGEIAVAIKHVVASLSSHIDGPLLSPLSQLFLSSELCQRRCSIAVSCLDQSVQLYGPSRASTPIESIDVLQAHAHVAELASVSRYRRC